MLAEGARRLVVYGATGVFFLVAALVQLGGGDPIEVFLKAAIACAVVTTLGRMIVGLVEVAEKTPDSPIAEPSAAGEPSTAVQTSTEAVMQELANR